MTILWIDLSKWYAWNALDKPVYGLIINRFNPIYLMIYWVFHNSLIHLSYVSLLFIFAIIPLDLELEEHWKLIVGAIIILPFPVAIISQIIGFALYHAGSRYMWSVMFDFTFIGASMLGWAYIGASRDIDIFVIMGFLAPFLYKIFISGILDFTPDIAHLSGYFFGRYIRN